MGIPTWIFLLFLLPFTGLGVLACLLGASGLTTGVVIWAERRHTRRDGAEATSASTVPHRRPLGPLAAAGLTLGAVVLVAYILFVIRAA